MLISVFAIRIQVHGEEQGKTCLWQERFLGFEIALVWNINDGVHRRCILVYKGLTLPITNMSLFENDILS